jgi:hypothetical protein
MRIVLVLAVLASCGEPRREASSPSQPAPVLDTPAPTPTPTRANDAPIIPSGSGWWCMDMAGPIGVCERTEALCRDAIDSMPWGGIPPSCVQRATAYCATYVLDARRTYGCRRDAAGCDENLARLRAAAPTMLVLSACDAVP